MTNWSHLETPLYQEPKFFVEKPDGRRDRSELARQDTFFKLMLYAAPGVLCYPVPNAGRRNPYVARKEHILGGVFDIEVKARGPLVAMIELKGYDRRGQPGKLRSNQVDFGNRCVDLGIPCACFFSPHRAVDWLRDQGFPIAAVSSHAA